MKWQWAFTTTTVFPAIQAGASFLEIFLMKRLNVTMPSIPVLFAFSIAIKIRYGNSKEQTQILGAF